MYRRFLKLLDPLGSEQLLDWSWLLPSTLPCRVTTAFVFGEVLWIGRWDEADVRDGRRLHNCCSTNICFFMTFVDSLCNYDLLVAIVSKFCEAGGARHPIYGRA